MMRAVGLALTASLAGGCVCPAFDAAALRDEPLVRIAAVDPRIRIDMRYATANNFTQRVLYDAPEAYLRASVAERLKRAQDDLERDGLYLVVYDAYRPWSVQWTLWSVVADPDYVADPRKGSRHNRGAAVDVGLVDRDGNPLPMPSAYDEFTPRAHRDYAGASPQERANRERLECALFAQGFTGLATEWWHFDAPHWAWYPIADESLRALSTRR